MQPGRSYVGSEPPLRAGNPEDDDEQLRLAIEASLREMEMRPSAPVGAEEPEYKVSRDVRSLPTLSVALADFRFVRSGDGNDIDLFEHDGSDGGVRRAGSAALPACACTG